MRKELIAFPIDVENEERLKVPDYLFFGEEQQYDELNKSMIQKAKNICKRTYLKFLTNINLPSMKILQLKKK